MAKHEGRRIAVGALLVGLAGFLTGILTAPKSGRETRKDIKKAAGSAVREIEKQLKTVHTELQELSEKAVKLAHGAGREAKKDAEVIMKRAADAQSKVKEILSTIHEGTADDPELRAALKEANAAKAHLKKYLAKQSKTK